MILVVLFCCVWCSTLVEAATAWTNVDGVFYNDKGEVIKGALSKGIDVSYHQGIIDWGKVKQTDIEFVLIRCGYGDDDIGQDDKYFKQNIQGCSENNIQYGIYIYSHAINTEMAKSEVNHVLRLVRETNANPTYPIYYDIEANEQEKLSNDLLGNIAETFCNKILEAGYKVGIYSNLYWWNNRLTDKRFENWDKWVAQYNSSCDYSRQYNIWQFTDGGKVPEIPESVGVNILLARECSVSGHTYALQSVIKKATTTHLGVATYKCKVCGNNKKDLIQKLKKVSLNKGSFVYNGKANKPAVTIKDSSGKVISKLYYTVSYSNNIKPGYAEVKVKFKKLYKGIMNKKFIIKPAKVKLSKIVNQKGRMIKITWEKSKGVGGYEIWYANDKKLKKGRKIMDVKASSKAIIIKKLSKNKTYYVKIRGYKKINKRKVYGAWSKRKSVKITK